MSRLRTYTDAEGRTKISAPVPGWPTNDTLTPVGTLNRLAPRKDKGTRYVFDNAGTRRIVQ